MDIPPVVYVPLIITLIGLAVYWSRYNINRMVKQIDSLIMENKEMEKRISSVEYNYLDRFNLLNNSIHKMELTILKELSIIKGSLEEKNTKLYGEFQDLKGRLGILEGEHGLIHKQLLNKETK